LAVFDAYSFTPEPRSHSLKCTGLSRSKVKTWTPSLDKKEENKEGDYFGSSVGVMEKKRGQGEAFNEPETPSTAQYKVPKLRLGQLIKDNPHETPAGTPMYSFPVTEVTPGSL